MVCGRFVRKEHHQDQNPRTVNFGVAFGKVGLIILPSSRFVTPAYRRLQSQLTEEKAMNIQKSHVGRFFIRPAAAE